MGIKDGDCLALYSDGVDEARNIRKEEFGVKTLQRIMVDNRSRSSQEILDQAILKLNAFMGKADQHDDITLIIVKIDASTE
jgi:sigma-B regulation protein RsbU (phosphoserine phosphatase)